MQPVLKPKNPYLSQYKHSISAQQKLIRQRIGAPEPDNVQDNVNKDDDSIPSIDDETIGERSSERVSKTSYSYFNNDAEESLQFFKKNLVPGSIRDKDTKVGLQSTSYHPRELSSNFGAKSSDELNAARSRAPLDTYKLTQTKSSKSYQTPIESSSKSVPFKQTSLNEPTQLKRQSVFEFTTLSENLPTPATDVNDNESDLFGPSKTTKSISRTSVDRVPALDATKSNLDDRHRSSSHRERRSGQAEPRGSAKPTSPRLPESPISSDAFSRKGSLLKAHDSIRLKINRPKARQKPENVADTVVDDSVELKELDSISNERAVDVKRRSSKKKKKSKESEEQTKVDENEKLPVRNFSEVRIVKITRSENERSLGVTVNAEDGNIVVARILAGGLADKQGALQVGDLILALNNREVYTPEQLQEQLRKSSDEDVVTLKIVPSFRDELPTLCLYLRALFNYDANEDTLLPCKEVGVSFNQGDILEVVNQEDPIWWQARRVDSENLQTGLIPCRELEETRRAFVVPDFDLATRTSLCGTKVSKKSKKKEIYNVGQNNDFDKAELQLYEEVCRTPAFERRTLVLIGANGVGKQALKARIVSADPDRFGTPLPHTSRLPRDGEENGIHYHFVTREQMEEDIINGKYLEYGEYDGALYGTKLDSVREIIGSGKVCVLDCSPTCLKILKTSDYLPFVAFIAAPTLDQLRYTNDWNRGNKTYATFDRVLSRQSKRAKTLQDFAFDFFEDEDLQLTVEESARLFRTYENYFDIVLVNNNFEWTYEQLREAIDALSMAPQWIPISWIYGA